MKQCFRYGKNDTNIDNVATKSSECTEIVLKAKECGRFFRSK